MTVIYSSMTERTVFQKIWEGDLPSHTLYRNDAYGLLAMLDIFPATPGHTLVVPREAVDRWTDLPDVRLVQATILGKFVGRHLQAVLSPVRVTRHTIGYGVPHIHDQYIPSYVRGDTANLYNAKRMECPAPAEELHAMAEKLRFSADLTELADLKLAEVAAAFHVPSLG